MMAGNPGGTNGSPSRRFLAAAGVIFLVAVAVKLALLGHIGGRIYGDVQRSLNFGYAVEEGRANITTHSEQSKTFVAPLLWYRVFTVGGVTAIKAVNFALFGALFVVQLLLARRLMGDDAALVASVLFAFYVGTGRNVVAGEPDDLVVALGVATAILIWSSWKRTDLAGMLIGLAFLFKFSAAVFFLGFAVYLVIERRWKALAIISITAAVPFAVVNLIDGGQSLRGLLASTGVQSGVSPWTAVGFKFLSTGILAGTIIASYEQWRRPTDGGKLLLPLALCYPIYMIVMRDAYASSYVGMLWIVFAGPLMAAWILQLRGGRFRQRAVLGTVLAAYVFTATAITAYRLHHDTQDLYLTRGVSYEPRESLQILGR